MTLSNTEIEMLWVDAWNAVYDITQSRDDYPCVLPDHSCVSVRDCLDWLQESVYAGYSVSVERAWYQGQPAVRVSRRPRELP